MRIATVPLVLTVLALSGPTARAEDVPAKYQDTITRGLEWVAKQQYHDGHWDANNNQNPTTMTSLGGMVLLMEGSTLREGKYSNHIKRAVDWLVKRVQPNGLIGNPAHPIEGARYIYGHGYAMLFLASAYGEEEDGDRRKRLEEVLTKAVEFSGKAQTSRGGWGYVSGTDSGGFDEGSTTITQLQGLRACRNAGIVVPKSIIDNAHKYMEQATTERGSVIYSLAGGNHEGGPALAAAALAGSFSSGEYTSKRAKKYIQFCRTAIPIGSSGRFGHDEYTHYYYAQALYVLGEEGYAKLFPDSSTEDRMTWSKYRAAMFEHLKATQAPDGSWGTGQIGPIFSSAVNLTILQLDNGTLPIYQR